MRLTTHSRPGLLLATALLTLAACATSANRAGAQAAVDTAVAHPDRSDADRDRDAGRKPAAVLAFFGLAPGMRVLDLYTGGGYYTEVVARAVGERGSVVSHNNTPYLNFVGDEYSARLAPGRLPNVERLTAENNALTLDAGEFDMALMILAHHDLYWSNQEASWEPVDVPAFAAQVFRSLKPGGVLGVVDHNAPAGAPVSTANDQHRIDPDLIIADWTAAGFTLDARSYVLQNEDDSLEGSPFAPEIRGQTDRAVLRFVKPADG